MSDGYTTEEQDLKVYVTEKRMKTKIFRYSYWTDEDNAGWWIVKEYHNVESPFPQKYEIWIPNDVLDQIIVHQTKNKLKK